MHAAAPTPDFPPPPPPTGDVAEQMAALMLEREASHGGCFREDLLAAGFTLNQIESNQSRAVRLAVARQVRVTAPLRAFEERSTRIRRGAALVAGMLPGEAAIIAHLRQSGFSVAELADLYPEILAAAAARLRPAPAAAGAPA